MSKYKNIIPGLVSIETDLKSIRGFYLSEDFDFYTAVEQRQKYHYIIRQDNKISIPTEYDFRNGYYTKTEDVWYYQRKFGLLTFKFSYEPLAKTFKYNKSFEKVLFEVGSILPVGKLIGDIINLDMFLDNYVVFHGCAVQFPKETICLIGLGYNGKTTFVRKSLENGAKYIGEDIIVIDIKDNKVYPISPFHKKMNFARKINRELSKYINKSVLIENPVEIDKLYLIQNTTNVDQDGQAKKRDSKDIYQYLITCSLSFLGDNLTRSIILEENKTDLLFQTIQSIKEKRDKSQFINLINFDFTKIYEF